MHLMLGVLLLCVIALGVSGYPHAELYPDEDPDTEARYARAVPASSYVREKEGVTVAFEEETTTEIDTSSEPSSVKGGVAPGNLNKGGFSENAKPTAEIAKEKNQQKATIAPTEVTENEKKPVGFFGSLAEFAKPKPTPEPNKNDKEKESGFDISIPFPTGVLGFKSKPPSIPNIFGR